MKKLASFKKNTNGIKCEETKAVFKYLKKQGKTPYLITHSSKSYYSIRFHHKKRYLDIIPSTKKWNISSQQLKNGSHTFFPYRDIKDLFEYFMGWD